MQQMYKIWVNETPHVLEDYSHLLDPEDLQMMDETALDLDYLDLSEFKFDFVLNAESFLDSLVLDSLGLDLDLDLRDLDFNATTIPSST